MADKNSSTLNGGKKKSGNGGQKKSTNEGKEEESSIFYEGENDAKLFDNDFEGEEEEFLNPDWKDELKDFFPLHEVSQGSDTYLVRDSSGSVIGTCNINKYKPGVSVKGTNGRFISQGKEEELVEFMTGNDESKMESKKKKKN